MIGVVTGVQGMRWYEVTVTGQDAHTGATPMHLRRNALLGAARAIDAIDAIAGEFAPHAVATVGLIESRPNSRNVIPGEAFFTVDLRHPDEAVKQRLAAEIRRRGEQIATDRGVSLNYSVVSDVPPKDMDSDVKAHLHAAAAACGVQWIPMISGAGHDSQVMATRVPTAMLFVPSFEGRSHSAAEYTSAEDAAQGATVLATALHRLAF